MLDHYLTFRLAELRNFLSNNIPVVDKLEEIANNLGKKDLPSKIEKIAANSEEFDDMEIEDPST